MATRTLSGSPSILPLYARAAAPLIPGASLLPFVPGRGDEVPDLDLKLAGVRAEPQRVAAYAKVCGFTLRGELPPTYPHVLAFPLHMAVMADGSFPFGAVGLVHVANRIVQHRPLGIEEELTIRVRPTQLRPHPKGRTFSLETEILTGRQKAWTSTSTMLRRGAPAEFAVAPAKREETRTHDGGFEPLPGYAEASAEWELRGDLGRRYAAVSGDRNPIHMHSLTAKPLGFPAAIAHGMWTKARCLAALESRLPEALDVEVRFRRPILLPGRVQFASAERDGETVFAVRGAKRKEPHLDGRLQPIEPKQKPKSGGKRGK